ncbi:hypothetical protein QR680_016433 [Steinernema hermaphroditum]|uniref:UDP-glucuronosyltransferase n=1 Tax=Steinernema hermaphroditum TaxID=289476 RepID=A0AA39HB79_9BILA|nr:hypothetical protein QR680_016433 [Steinernema hermaphroditum]
MYVSFAIAVLFSNVFYLNGVFAADILITAAHDSDSHFNSMKPFFVRLSKAGHNVTVLDTSTKKEPRDFGPGIKVLHIYMPPKENKVVNADFFWTMDTHSFLMPVLFGMSDALFGELMDEHPDQFNTILSTNWDLIVMDELFAIHQNAICFHLKQTRNTPYIVFSPSTAIMTNFINAALGRYSSTKIGTFTKLPVDSSDVWNPTRFSNRLRGFVEDAIEHVGMRYILPFVNFKNFNRLKLHDFTFAEFVQRQSLHLSDHFDRLIYPVPEAVNFKYIGSHCGAPKSLPTDYLDFVNDPTSKGTIYVAFGSIIAWDNAPEYVVRAFEGALNELKDYRIIFAYKGKRKLIVGSHVMLTTWAPQLDVLTHDNTKLFISHGGLKSLKEALCTRTPVIYMPIFAEQAMNTRISLELGFGKTVNKYTINKETLLEAMHDILDNYDYYKNKIDSLYEIYMDRIIPSLDEGLFYAEKVLRGHFEKQQVKRKGVSLGWIEHLYFDHLALLLIALFILK